MAASLVSLKNRNVTMNITHGNGAALRAFGTSGAWARPASFNSGCDSAARAEYTANHGPDGVTGLYDVFENLVDDVLLKDSQIAIAEEVFLQRFQLEASAARHVADGEGAKIGQAGLGTNGGQFRIVDHDFVAGELILPGFDRGKVEIKASFGVVVCVAWFLCHICVLYGSVAWRRLVVQIAICSITG